MKHQYFCLPSLDYRSCILIFWGNTPVFCLQRRWIGNGSAFSGRIGSTRSHSFLMRKLWDALILRFSYKRGPERVRWLVGWFWKSHSNADVIDKTLGMDHAIFPVLGCVYFLTGAMCVYVCGYRGKPLTVAHFRSLAELIIRQQVN